jgi:hypothetical protein
MSALGQKQTLMRLDLECAPNSVRMRGSAAETLATVLPTSGLA